MLYGSWKYLHSTLYSKTFHTSYIENFYYILWFTYMLKIINFSNSYFYNKSKRADLKADFKMDYIIQLYMQYSVHCKCEKELVILLLRTVLRDTDELVKKYL